MKDDSEKEKSCMDCRLLIFHCGLSLEKNKETPGMIRPWVYVHNAAHNTEGALNPHGFREVLLAEPALKDFPEDEQGKEWSVEIYLCLCKHWYIYLLLWGFFFFKKTRSMSLTKLSIVHTKFNVTQLNFSRPFLFAQLKLDAHWTATPYPPPLSICIYFQLYCLSLQLPGRNTHLKAGWRTASSLQH